MKTKGSKAWKIIRWILFLPAALAAFSLISSLAAGLFEGWWYSIVLGVLATAVSIYVGKAVAPSPRVSVPLVALAALASIGFQISVAAPAMEDAKALMFLGWPVGVALGFIISTEKGSERSRVLRSLRWALFLPAAVYAGIATLLLSMWIYNSVFPLSDPWSRKYSLGIASAIFVCVSGLLAPSHRAAIILLSAPLSYFIAHDEASRAHYFDGSAINLLIAWAIGTAVGAFVALKAAVGVKKPSRAAADTEHKKRRYKGTAPYQDLDLDRKTFFGRKHESRSLLNLVLAERLVVLFAKSGMGKSSLINAGLVEPLRKRRYFPIVVRLNDQVHGPIKSLLEGVRSAAGEAHVDVVDSGGKSAWRLFKTAEFWSEENDLLRPVIILDQFEEIFTLHSPAVRQEFIGQLGELVRGRSAARPSNEDTATEGKPLDDAPPTHLKVVIALREDFLANLEELAREIPAILHNRFRLGPLSRETAREAIIGPARLADDIFQTEKFSYQEEAVQRMIAFLAKRQFGAETTESDEVEPVQLQLICHYLEETVRHRQADVKKDTEIEISEADLGGEAQMQQVMEGFYDRTIAALTPHHKARAVQRLCEKRLVSSSGRRLTEDHDEIKRRFRLSDKILLKLVDARLLRAESRLGGTFYEVSHDRLVEPILKSRKKRIVKQRWIAAAAIPLLLAAIIGSVSLVNAHQMLKAQKERDKFGMLSRNSENAIRSMASLVGRHKFDPKLLLEEIKKPSVLNPAIFVILSMSERKWIRHVKFEYGIQTEAEKIINWEWADEDMLSVLQHIRIHHDVFLGSEKGAGVPTLLGALLFILDGFERSFEKVDKKKEVSNLKDSVIKEYKKKYFRQDPELTNDNTEPDAYDDARKNFVTKKKYQSFFLNYEIPSSADPKEPVAVNWLEAFAYAACMDKKLPRQEEVKNYRGKIAMRYRDMLTEHLKQPSWRWGKGRDELLDTLIRSREFNIYLP